MASKNNRYAGYNYGSTAPDWDVRIAVKEEPKRQLNPQIRRNREKASHMTLPFVMILSVLMVVCGFKMVGYISLQSGFTSTAGKISALEKQLESVRATNDENYANIIDSVDLNEVKRVAIEELGMVYAEESQIVIYEGNDHDYVKQYATIP